jgi:signal transduction histidine kinase
VFLDRKGTLDSGVSYLETLAANYARLTPKEGGGPADVRAAVDDVLQAVQPGAVTLRADVPPNLPLVRADALVLRRILQNLVGNAVDASVANGKARAGTVVVSAERTDRDGSAVRITIRDTGCGMTGDQLERAFEDFYTTKAGGTGLGLSIVRRLVADLEGSLKVETEPGAGTTVTMTLPSAGQSAPRSTP